MIIETIIEFIDNEGELDYFDVELEGNPVLEENDYSDEYGLVEVEATMIMDGEITWRRKDYTDLQNAQIADYLKANEKAVNQLFFDEF